MSTVTPKLNLTKPAGIEQYSLPLLNANFDKIDAAVPIWTTANSTYNTSNANFTNSTFARISFGTRGLIFANFMAVLGSGYSVVVPANTEAAVKYNSAVVPADMKPLYQVGTEMGGVFSNESRGDNLQCYIDTTGAIGIRSTGAGFTRSSGGTLNFRWSVVYEWDGAE